MATSVTKDQGAGHLRSGAIGVVGAVVISMAFMGPATAVFFNTAPMTAGAGYALATSMLLALITSITPTPFHLLLLQELKAHPCPSLSRKLLTCCATIDVEPTAFGQTSPEAPMWGRDGRSKLYGMVRFGIRRATARIIECEETTRHMAPLRAGESHK